MCGRKGFTLIETIVVMIIIGIAAAIAVPNYYSFIQSGASKAAQNNLTTIYAAEKNYYFNNGSYCINSGPNPTCADNLADINTHLSLNITDNYFTYACGTNLTYGFYCTATNISNPAVNLTSYGGAPAGLPGGSCASDEGTACGGTACFPAGTYQCDGSCSGGAVPPINGTCTAWSSCSTLCGSGTETCTASTPPQCGGSPAVTTRSCIGNTPVNGTCTAWGTCFGACHGIGIQSCLASGPPQCGGHSALGTIQVCSPC